MPSCSAGVFRNTAAPRDWQTPGAPDRKIPRWRGPECANSCFYLLFRTKIAELDALLQPFSMRKAFLAVFLAIVPANLFGEAIAHKPALITPPVTIHLEIARSIALQRLRANACRKEWVLISRRCGNPLISRRRHRASPAPLPLLPGAPAGVCGCPPRHCRGHPQSLRRAPEPLLSAALHRVAHVRSDRAAGTGRRPVAAAPPPAVRALPARPLFQESALLGCVARAPSAASAPPASARAARSSPATAAAERDPRARAIPAPAPAPPPAPSGG